MSNEVEVIEEVKGEVLVPTPKEAKYYNRNFGNSVLALPIKCRKVKAKKGNKFTSVKCAMNLRSYDENGNDLGIQNRWVGVHFKMEAFKTIPKEMKIHDAQDLTTGTLYVKASGLQAPKVWRVVQDTDEDGKELYNEDGTAKMRYPAIWIREGILGFEAEVANQNAFGFVDTVEDAQVEASDEGTPCDEETGEIIEDEPLEI